MKMVDTNDILSPPLLTADLPGVGGRIKSVPEDFQVDELPAYEPAGEGKFLYLWIEKSDMGAEYFLRFIAKRLEIPTGDVGCAGLKDRRAVTRQWISVPDDCEKLVSRLDGDGVRVLKTDRHRNKLRSGHLRGNRFDIIIREPDGDETRLANLVDRIRNLGFPNYYGVQRFGADGENVAKGLRLLHGEPFDSEKRPNKFLRKLLLSAVQSTLFNHYLAGRLNDGVLHRVLHGDVMSKCDTGGMFTAEDVETEQRRFDAKETISMGPIFGRKTFAAQFEAAHREAETIAHFDLTRKSFDGFGKLLQGSRRANLVYVNDLSAVMHSNGIHISFTLPSGSYATVLLREVMKSDGNFDQTE